MTYKIKSLLYFTCFIASALMYYSMDKAPQTNEVMHSVEIIDTDLEKVSYEEIAQLGDFQ